MAIPQQTPYNNYNGNGSTTVFAYTFKIFTATDLKVYVDGTLKTLTTDYTVSGEGVLAGGNVTFLVAPANGTVVDVLRAVPYDRLVDYQTSGDLLADTLDDDIDRIECQIQQLNQSVADAVFAPLPGADFDAVNRRIVNLADPVDAQDAMTYASSKAAVAAAEVARTAAELAETNAETAQGLAEAAQAAAESAASILADGDKGDITVSGSGATWTVDNNVITPAKMSRTGTAGQVLTSGGAGADPGYTPQSNVTAGAVSVVDPSKAIGYGAGAGGTVTQATSKTTGVTLNKPCGQITMNNAALAAGAIVQFTLNNSLISALDTVIPTLNYNANYTTYVVGVAAGTAAIVLKNISGGSLSDAVTINFAIIKGANS